MIQEAWIRSTNPLERFDKKVKHGADVVGIFTGEGSIVSLIGALLLQANDEWATQNRCMQIEPMAELLPPTNEGEVTPDDTIRVTPRAA